MKYIAICLSRSEGSCENFRVSRGKKSTFDTLDEVSEAVAEDMKEYLEAELNAGRKAFIVGNSICWENDDGEYEAKWYVYGID